MSLATLLWAVSLPHNACSGIAFRVLTKLADVTRSDLGYTAWRAVGGERGMAVELGVSTRTIQRALAELQESGLIRKGDQSFVQHIRADRRPTVFDVLTPSLVYSERFPDIPSETDNPRGDIYVTPQISRGDNAGSSGVTSAVGRAQIKPSYLQTHTEPLVGNRASKKIQSSSAEDAR